jgi:hypothetical protein
MTTYWWDEKDGDDSNDGLAPETAFKTHQRLIEALKLDDIPPAIFVFKSENIELVEKEQCSS